MDKLIFSSKRELQSSEQPVIRISGDAARAIMEIQQATALPVKHIASQMILFASEHVEIE